MKLIEKANKNSDDVSHDVDVLLEYIDHFANPREIITQYGPHVNIGQIRS